MNFTDLYRKITNIDKGLTESELLECPCEEGPMEQQKQQDSVNMNVTINGQGSTGIRDLMDILRNIEKDVQDGDEQNVLVDEPEEFGVDDESEEGEYEFDLEPFINHDEEPSHQEEEPEELMTDEYENSAIGGSDAAVYGISAITAIGNDLLSKRKEAPKQAGGGNPWNIKESLITELANLYKEVKLR